MPRIAARLLLPGVVLLLGCHEKVLVECVDPQGNPVPCSAGKGGADGADGTGGADAKPDGTDGADGADGTDGTDGGSDGGTDGVDPPPDESCAGKCGEYWDGAKCQCDEHCSSQGDCCVDFAEECPEVADGTDGTDGTDGSDGVDPWKDYVFPKPFDDQKLSYHDCRGLASDGGAPKGGGNSSWCQSYDCRGIVKWDSGYCTTKDCGGIASGNYADCDSSDCKGIAKSRACLKARWACEDDAEGSDAKAKCKTEYDSCISDAVSFCQSYHCRAWVKQDASYCSSGGDNGNCRAIVKGDASYCFSGP